LRFKAPNLQHLIGVAESKFQVKSSSITITLHKEAKEDWTDIHSKKALIGDNYKKPVRGSGDEGFEKGLN